MALTLAPKDPQEVVRYSWAPALADGDGIASYTLVETGCTVDSDEIVGDEVVFFVSAGVAGTIGSIVATAVTNDGETLEDTLYLPIQASTLAFDDTAQDICSFALRKVKGVRGTPTATESADALERLNNMLASWTRQGADVGAMLPLSLVSRVYCEDAFLDAIKANLILKLADLYGFQPAPTTVMEARTGLSLIKNAKLSDEREGAAYF
jgi:hypothetical protein